MEATDPLSMPASIFISTVLTLTTVLSTPNFTLLPWFAHGTRQLASHCLPLWHVADPSAPTEIRGSGQANYWWTAFEYDIVMIHTSAMVLCCVGRTDDPR